MRNIFEALVAGAKSRPASQTPTNHGKGNPVSYVTCPLCDRTVPEAFANAHVSTCLEAQRSRETRTPGAQALEPPGGSQLPQQVSNQQQNAVQHRGPAVSPVVLDLASDDDAEELVANVDSPVGPQTAAPVAPPQPAQGARPGGLHTDGGPAPAGLLSAGPAPGGALQQQAAEEPLSHHDTQLPSQLNAPNAFDIMRKSQQRAAQRTQCFFLERTSDGCWQGHWWVKGCATAAQQQLASCWSTTVTAAPAAGRGGAKETVQLFTNVAPGEGSPVTWDDGELPSNTLPSEGRWRGGLSVLKSALQKAVRLGRGPCAVRLALQLTKEDPPQLLRRLSVVCVEDGVLHPGLPLVVWLMAAQARGYTLGRVHVDGLLALLYQMAAVGVRDGLSEAWEGVEAGGEGDAPQQLPSLAAVDGTPGLGPSERCLVKCLLLRASYGGMVCDVRMLRGFAAYWVARFRGEAVPPPPSPDMNRSSPAAHTPGRGGTTPPPPNTSTCPPPQPVPPPCSRGAAQGTPRIPAPGSASPDGLPAHSYGSSLGAAGAGVCGGGGSGQEDGGDCKGAHGAETAPEAGVRGDVGGAQQRLTEEGQSSPPLAGGSVPVSACKASPAADAYFAGRLQADDAPPSCSTFMLASQLMTEQAQEQTSLWRYARPTQAHTHNILYLQQQQQQQQPSSQQPWPTQDHPASTQAQGHATLPAPAVEMVHPLWRRHTGGAATGGRSATATAAPHQGPQDSPWLQYLHDLYDTVSVPAPLCDVRRVGPVRRSDLPLSAVDFHVSEVITHLMERPEVQAAMVPAGGCGGGSGGGSQAAPAFTDPEDALKSAMWLFRSCTNHRRWLHAECPACPGRKDGMLRDGRGATELACPEHHSLCSQLQDEEERRRGLRPLWAAAGPWADRFSSNFIRRRFGPP